MAMRAMTRELVDIDNQLHTLAARLHDETWLEILKDPCEMELLQTDIDLLLERRYAISTGTARGSRHA